MIKPPNILFEEHGIDALDIDEDSQKRAVFLYRRAVDFDECGNLLVLLIDGVICAMFVVAAAFITTQTKAVLSLGAVYVLFRVWRGCQHQRMRRLTFFDYQSWMICLISRKKRFF